MNVLITGWAGFIGSNLVRHLLDKTDWNIFGMDSFTYAARPLWVYQHTQHNPQWAHRFTEIIGANDIRKKDQCELAIGMSEPDVIIHLAAESHVCRSIQGPGRFVDTNIIGTYTLLEAAQKQSLKKKLIFHHVSTDEVYGEADNGLKFNEDWQYRPRSPYAASKAASDHLVMAYHHTYGMDCRISNCSNNFGPNQHEEKLIPKAIIATLKGSPVTVYGPGTQVRDWIWVADHCDGILRSIVDGKAGQQYLFGGETELTNLEVVQHVRRAVENIAREEGKKAPSQEVVITNDRPTDDKRYAIDWSKARKELKWRPYQNLFMERLEQTVRWYRANAL